MPKDHLANDTLKEPSKSHTKIYIHEQFINKNIFHDTNIYRIGVVTYLSF